jgi:hypothetical protein
MSYLKVNAVVNHNENDVLDVQGDMSPQEITDIFFNILSHMLKFDNEDEVFTLLHMLIMSHIEEEE